MPYVRATTKNPMYWAAGNPVLAAGCMEPGGVTVTGHPLASGENENDFLAAVAKTGVGYKPLVVGESLQFGDIRSKSDGELVLVRKDVAYIGQDVTTDLAFCCYSAGANANPEWLEGEKVLKGACRWFKQILYEALRGHQALPENVPPNVDFWKAADTQPIKMWAEKTDYKEGDRVDFKGTVYICLKAHISEAGRLPSDTPNLWKVNK